MALSWWFWQDFCRVLGPSVIRRYPDRILNIHPSLIPSFLRPRLLRPEGA